MTIQNLGSLGLQTLGGFIYGLIVMALVMAVNVLFTKQPYRISLSSRRSVAFNAIFTALVIYIVLWLFSSAEYHPVWMVGNMAAFYLIDSFLLSRKLKQEQEAHEAESDEQQPPQEFQWPQQPR